MSKQSPDHLAAKIIPAHTGLDQMALESARATVGRVAFGKRLQSPERELSFRRARLDILAAELNLLFAYRIEAAEPFCAFSDEAEPSLILGRTLDLSLAVEIEPATGLYVLYDTAPAGSIVITASEERLVDHVVSVVACATGDLTARNADAAVDVLVGRSLEDVEKRLILRTLLNCSGDRRQTAFALGLDEGALRARLRRYLLAQSRALSSPEEAQ